MLYRVVCSLQPRAGRQACKQTNIDQRPAFYLLRQFTVSLPYRFFLSFFFCFSTSKLLLHHLGNLNQVQLACQACTVETCMVVVFKQHQLVRFILSIHSIFFHHLNVASLIKVPLFASTVLLSLAQHKNVVNAFNEN